MSKSAGMLFLIAGFLIFMGITTSEIFYPNYSVRNDYISNLGSTRPPHIVIHQPSSNIFDSTILIGGLLIIVSAYFLHKVKKDHAFWIIVSLMGIGNFGVGLFPAFHKFAHPFFAFFAFVAGGIGAILSSRVTTAPFKYFSIALGSTALVFLVVGVLFTSQIIPFLGIGGTERWVAYPILIWLMSFGGYLMNSSNKK